MCTHISSSARQGNTTLIDPHPRNWDLEETAAPHLPKQIRMK